MDDERQHWPQVFCLLFSPFIKRDVNSPRASFLCLNNAGLFEVGKGRNHLITLGFDYSNLSDAFDSSRMLKRYALGIVRRELAILAELEEQSRRRYVWAYWRALLYLSLGNRDKAIQSLELGITDHEGLETIFIKVDPMLDSLRGDPRFEALVQKVVGAEQK